MIRDMAARNASLDNDYGVSAGPNAAASHVVALLDQDGVELAAGTAPGYSRAELDPSDWGPSVDGTKTAIARFPAPDGEWVPAASWVLLDPATGTGWDAGDLADPLLVTSASDDGPQVAVTVFYSTVQP